MTSLDRRELMQRAMLLLGATTLPTGEALAAAAKKGKAGLTPAKFSLLSAVADTIVPQTDTPGAVQVGVPKLIDGLLRNWASPKRRDEMIGALDRIDALAKTQTKKGFAALPPAKRAEVLKPHDVAALKPIPRADGRSGFAALLEGPSVADNGYGKLKELIVILYYTSEVGLTKELSYLHNPGKWQPSVPVTPDTRPSGGAGLF